jgi:hypothetical protein
MKPRKIVTGVLGGLLIAFLLVILFGAAFAVTLPFHLAFGWALYAQRIWPTVTLSPSAIASALITLAALVAVAQGLARRARPGWPLRWTFAGIGAVVAMFAASIAGAGVVHQLGWLMTTPDRLIANSWTRPQMDHLRSCSLLELRSLPPGPQSAASLRAHLFRSRLTEPNERFEIYVDDGLGTERYLVLLVPRDPELRAKEGARLCGRTLDQRIPVEEIDALCASFLAGTSSTATVTERPE